MKSLCLAAALLAVTLAGQDAAGVIDGIVTDDAGAPVAAASVVLMSESGRVLRTLEADDTGAFLFGSLTDGRYTVGASKVGYAPRGHGQASAAAGRVVIALSMNGRFRARIRLPRLGGLAGTIVDESSQPVSVAVQARRFVLLNGVRTLEDRAIVTEADRQGRYHFADVTPGDYLVSALGPDGALRPMTPDVIQRALQAIQQPGQPLPPHDAAAESTVSYVTVYYPGVMSRARATAVPLGPGEERTNLNLQLQVLPSLRLEGTVLGQNGKPAAYATARLSSADDGVTWSYGQTSPTGYFHLAPVPPGAYVLSVSGTRLDISLTDPQATNVTVHLEGASSITGRVVFDGTTARPDCRRVSCRPALVSRSAPPGGGTPSSDMFGVMDPAGPVAFTGVPAGAYTVALGIPMTGWTMESAVIDGRDVMDLPLEVAPHQDVSGLVVTFTDRAAELTGSTPVGGTAPPADAVTVVVFPADRRLWVPGARRVRVARPDTSGHYRVAGLPPGDYLVAVVTNFDAEAELDAPRLAALEATATRVALRRSDPR